MGHHKQAMLEFDHFPSDVILDIEDIYWRLRRDVSVIWPQPVDWDLFFSVLFPKALCKVDRYIAHAWTGRDHGTLKECAQEISVGEYGIFEGIYEPNQSSALEKVIYRAGLEIKERLLDLVAYHRGVFPYTFRTMISDGCLFFSKNESIYDPRIPDSQF